MNDHVLIETWLNSLDETGCSPLTITSYRRSINQFISWYVKRYSDSQFEPRLVLAKDFNEWVTVMSDARAKPSSINQRIAAVRKFFSWLLVTGEIKTNPAKNVNFLALDTKGFQGLTEEEYRKLSRAVYSGENVRDIAIFEVMVGAGLRVGELLDLRLGDLVIRERETEKYFSYIIVREGKGRKRRSVPMSPSVKKALNDLLVDHPNRMAGNEPKVTASLWLGQRGELKDPSAISRILSHYGKMANLPADQVHPHAMRHTFAHRWLHKHPADIRTLAEILGHSDIKTTMIYTVSTDAEKASKMAAMG